MATMRGFIGRHLARPYFAGRLRGPHDDRPGITVHPGMGVGLRRLRTILLPALARDDDQLAPVAERRPGV